MSREFEDIGAQENAKMGLRKFFTSRGDINTRAREVIAAANDAMGSEVLKDPTMQQEAEKFVADLLFESGNGPLASQVAEAVGLDATARARAKQAAVTKAIEMYGRDPGLEKATALARGFN